MLNHSQKDILRKTEEVAELIELVASSEGLRPAQRRALEKARRLLRSAVSDILTCKPEHYSKCHQKVSDTLAEISELVRAYFCKSEDL